MTFRSVSLVVLIICVGISAYLILSTNDPSLIRAKSERLALQEEMSVQEVFSFARRWLSVSATAEGDQPDLLVTRDGDTYRLHRDDTIMACPSFDIFLATIVDLGNNYTDWKFTYKHETVETTAGYTLKTVDGKVTELSKIYSDR